MKTVDSGGTPGLTTYGISCSIHRDAQMSETLLGVRRQTAVSVRHPGVLSTPTSRVPETLLRSVIDTFPADGLQLLPDLPATPIGSEGSLQYPGSYLVESLMARKLGLSEALVRGVIRGTAQPRMIAAEEVADPLGTDETEHTVMLTLSVVLTAGSDHIPSSTGSYSRLIWAPTELIGKALVARDALLIDDTLNPFEVCIDGLCIRSVAYLAASA